MPEEQAPTTPTPEVPKEAPAPVADAAALQARIAQLEAQNTESQQAAQYWHSQARSTPAAQPKQTEEPEEDVLDLITRKGTKGVDELIAKRGYVKRDDVSAMVQNGIQVALTEQSLKTQYPDLKDPKSEFFKATSAEYNALVAKGVAPTVAAEIAAEKVELKELRDGKRKIESSTERDARIRAQSPEGTKRTTKKEDDDSDDQLTDYQKHLCEVMGVTEEAFKKRAKAGVQVGARLGT